MRRIVLAVLTVFVLSTSGCRWFGLTFYTATDSTVVADHWLGKWIGPEGTFLVLSRPSKDENRYRIEIQSLDSRGFYEGRAVKNGIEFVRDGNNEMLHAGSGQDTGMKWLLEKKNCIVIHTGEGFCRD